MKNYILIIILSFLSTSLYSQNKKIKSSKAEPHEKTSYNETGLLNSKKKKKKKKKIKKKEKNAEKTDYSSKVKKETKKRKAIDAEPHIDASYNRKKTFRKPSKKL